jgi:single-strand DNA-binding protein
MSLDLTVRLDEGPAESVPVVWPNPAAAAVKFVEGDDVVVVGRIRRRFFRAGGSTATRTEVHADKILSARSGVRIRTALEPRVEDLNL